MKQFLNINEAAYELGASESYVRGLIRGIRAHTPERYSAADICGRSKLAVRFVALQDFATYGECLKTAPPYRPLEREAELGIVSPAVDPHAVAVELLREAVRAIGSISI